MLAQPRRVALLVYLAMRTCEGPERRDSLLPIFWPESDASRARSALRNALHFLRRSLGKGAIESRTTEELCVDPERIWCDAVEFKRRVDGDRLEEALELYRGDLLGGFFISEAPEFERWVEDERTRLRQRAVAAALTLAERAEVEGRLALAVHHARAAVSLEEHNETAVRRLIELLDRAGDRSGALRVYESFAVRLEEVYGLQPSPETRAIAESRPGAPALATDEPPALAESVEPVEPDPTGVQAAPEALRAPHKAAEREASVGHETAEEVALPVHSWPGLRPLRWAAALLVLVVSLGAAVSLWNGKPEPSEPAGTISGDVVAVLPFSFRGSGDFAYLSGGIASLLSTSLNGAGELRSVDPRALQNALAGQDAVAGSLRPEAARSVAQRFRAGLYVFGDIVEAGGRLRVTATLYDSRSAADTPIEEVTAEGHGDDLFRLVDELTTGLLQGRTGSRLSRVAARTTHSVEAAKAYLRGEAHFHEGRYNAATRDFGRAVELDSTFALAHYRLSSVATWIGGGELAPRAAAQAVRYSRRLSPEDSLLVTGWRLHLAGAPDQALHHYHGVLNTRPTDVEAWFQLGELLFHWGPTLGYPTTQARAPFERVLSFEPNNAGALIHLARLAAREGRVEEIDSLVRRLMRDDPEGGWQLEMEVLRAFAAGDAEGVERMIQRIAEAPDPLAALGLRVSAAVHAAHLTGAIRLTRTVLASEISAERRAESVLLLAHLHAARGQWQAARKVLTTMRGVTRGRRLEYRAALASLPFAPTSAAEIEELRAALAAWQSPPLPAPGNPGARGNAAFPYFAWQGIYEPRRLYLLGTLSLRLNDTRGAASAAAGLEQLEGDTRMREFARQYAAILRARITQREQGLQTALDVLGSPQIPVDSVYPHLLSYPRADERFLRAELLDQLGRHPDALRWYATFPDPRPVDLIYLAPSHLEQARIHDALGQADQAAEHYARFIRLWKDSDPELRPSVEVAERRLEKLRSRSSGG